MAIDNKRIAKNTLFMYSRMIVQMIVFFYTSRIVINNLGLEDYGIFEVVGSIVANLIFLNNAMTVSTQRFITYAIGKNDQKYISDIFSASLLIHLALATSILVFGEIIGQIVLNYYINIPQVKMEDALWVFHFSLLSAFFLVISVPYTSLILSNERMDIYAAITLIDVFLKLGIASVLIFFTNRLIIYALLLLLESIFIRILYSIYCKKFLLSNPIRLVTDKNIYKDLTKFAGWSIIGNLAVVVNSQGLNILLNIFGGPIVNASRGIAVQVQTALYAFIVNVQAAINPQITKKYATGDLEEMRLLIFRSSKFNFYLLLILTIPILLRTHQILSIWLTEQGVPPHAPIFCQILLFVCLVDCLANPLMVGAAATGKIKKYQIIIGSTLLTVVPFATLFLKLGFPIEWAFIVLLVVSTLVQIVRIFLCKQMIKLDIKQYLRTVAFPCLSVFLLSFTIALIINKILPSNIMGLILLFLFSTLQAITIVYYIGLAKQEKDFIAKKIWQIIHKKKEL